MDIIINISIAIVSGAGGAGIIYLIAKTTITEKIKGKIKSYYEHQIEEFKAELKSRYEMKLESFRGELSKHTLVLGSVASAQKDAYSAYNQERVNAIKIYWNYYIERISEMHQVAELDKVVPKSNYDSLVDEIKNNPDISNLYKSLKEPKIFEVDERLMSIKKMTPFLTKELWEILQRLDYFFDRVSHLYIWGYKKGKIEYWLNDEFLVDNLAHLIDPIAIKFIYSMDSGGIRAVIGLTEIRVLAEISKITNGKAGAEYSLEQVNQILEDIKSSGSKITD